MRKEWSPEEVLILQDQYPSVGAHGLKERLDRKIKSIRDKAHALGIRVKSECIRKTLNTEDMRHFIEVKTPFAAYILGLIWADGYVPAVRTGAGYNVKFSMVEDDFADIENLVLTTGKWKIAKRTNGNGGRFGKYLCKKIAICQINSKTLHTFLSENDYQIKSGSSAYKILSKVPQELCHYWWRGYFDGDGSIHYGKTNAISLCSCIDQDWGFYRDLCEDLGIIFRSIKQQSEKSKSSRTVIASRKEIELFCEYIFAGEMFGLKRKRAVYEKIKENNLLKDLRRQKRKSSTYNGVYRYRGKRGDTWRMRVFHNKIFYNKKCDTEIQAAKEYDQMVRLLGFPFSKLNFPNEN